MVVVASGINKRTSVALPLIRGLADNRVEIKQQLFAGKRESTKLLLTNN